MRAQQCDKQSSSAQLLLPALHCRAVLHGVWVLGWNWVLLTTLFPCKTWFLSHLGRRQHVLQVQSIGWYKSPQQALNIKDPTTFCSTGRMPLFNLTLKGWLRYVLACSFNKHVIKLPSELSSTDVALLEEAGRTNNMCPRDMYCTTHYSKVVRHNRSEQAAGKNWAEAKMKFN